MNRKNEQEAEFLSGRETAIDKKFEELLLREVQLEHKHAVRKLELEYENAISKLRGQLEEAKGAQDWKTKEACNKVRKELEELATKADLARVDAEARLATYEKFDAKDERKSLQVNFDKLITSLSKSIEQTPEMPDITINNEAVEL